MRVEGRGGRDREELEERGDEWEKRAINSEREKRVWNRVRRGRYSETERRKSGRRGRNRE